MVSNKKKVYERLPSWNLWKVKNYIIQAQIIKKGLLLSGLSEYFKAEILIENHFEAWLKNIDSYKKRTNNV